MDQGVYPTSIFCIIATEFCERFSFCGLRTILSLYLRNILLFPETLAMVVYHVFIMLCYAVPLLGALLADGLLGRYRTILYFSIVYLAGNVLMCLAATPPVSLPPVLSTSFGLLLIAAGTGGIKPCVAAFGGDQFLLPAQECQLAAFFSLFYFTINLGGLVGMILTPLLRKGVTCFGDDTCYSLGFGFPAALMIVALLVFVLGRNWYRMKNPRATAVIQFIKCVKYAFCHWYKNKKHDEKVYRHWLDRASGRFDEKLIRDGKSLMRVLVLYLPLPVFWALFDQQGSRWTFQAARMNGDFFGFDIQPDQTQVANPLLALMLIPAFERGIYPRFPSLPASPLWRMFIGGLAAGGAFLASGLLELKLEETYPEFPRTGEAGLHIINTLPCEMEVLGLGPDRFLKPSQRFYVKDIPAKPWAVYEVLGFAPLKCASIDLLNPRVDLMVNVSQGQVPSVLVGVTSDNTLAAYLTEPQDLIKSLTGKPKLRVALMISSYGLHNASVRLENSNGFKDIYITPADNPGLKLSAYMELPPGDYEYSASFGTTTSYSRPTSISLKMGAVYSLVVRERRGIPGGVDFSGLFTLTPASTVHMFWLTPQYLLISIAEVMFAVSGLEFSFTQAPKSMKTVTIAAWYLSVATGNFLVICITQAKLFNSQAHEFFLYAILICLDMALFWKMATGYRYIDVEADGSSVSLIQKNKQHVPMYTSEDIIP